ncbi:MAG: hypothetical protein HGB08_02905 [Candidatus Moranbacteria bacterium]|nr:hypothetical protein [Candidatus Moranbacteria bacterium]
MNVRPIKTHKIVPGECDIFSVLDEHIGNIEEGSILFVTSKVVSICEGRVVKKEPGLARKGLAIQEAERYLEPEEGKRGMLMTIKNGMVCFNAGIDAFNSDGYFVLWPEDPWESSDAIRRYLSKKHGLNDFGVVITDTSAKPFRRGASGVAISGSGFSFLNDHEGREDLFGRKIFLTKSNIIDPLAAAAVLVMGECDEQTPMAIMTDIPFVDFRKDAPTEEEKAELAIDIEDDYYGNLFGKAEWKKAVNSNRIYKWKKN